MFLTESHRLCPVAQLAAMCAMVTIDVGDIDWLTMSKEQCNRQFLLHVP
jgi:hypothetical protein